MSENGSYAFITGGANGIGRAVAVMLVAEGCQVFIADRDKKAADALAVELNTKDQPMAFTAYMDVTSWDDQVRAFESAVGQFGRIDYVYPMAGIAERRSFPNTGSRSQGFIKPDLTVVDVNLTAVIYTVSLALQQFRRQEVNRHGFRGKIGLVSSVCGITPPTSLPVYSATKHGLVGLVRSFGKYLPKEKITLNAICPNVVCTNINTGDFYSKLDRLDLLTPMTGVVDGFKSMLGQCDISGECFEVGPSGGYVLRSPYDYLCKKSKMAVDLISQRGEKWHEEVEN